MNGLYFVVDKKLGIRMEENEKREKKDEGSVE